MTWAGLLSLPGLPCHFSETVALWVAASERRFRMGMGGGSRVPNPPRLPFQPRPVFEPGRDASAAQVAQALAFLKSPLCAEALEEEAKEQARATQVTVRMPYFYDLAQVPAEKEENDAMAREEQSKSSGNTVRFSRRFLFVAVLMIDPKAAKRTTGRGGKRRTKI